ncbi:MULTISPECIES: DUF2057 domain-containing protein [Shewanella]|jgi:hypothetical protein|uniref:Uncharacterized protein n=1 Tax=Shewanella fodinae TaxID=552357 RepID=A0A4R2FMK4_9GAMM|nr:MULTISPECIES: DUF2057 domain-containing protein [Shewanella]MDN5370932.1 uncharacterized protein [Shewanella sp.]MBO1273204.1 DUF2057 domain-containing protein [Shewanella sp. 4t3-1-2LB]MCD8476382.1 DUF2057 domain-containing protein [Shewanella fodinae]MCL2905054.1 DUF2057 domain-containing protein [Shewanella fodinae]TCN90213.1 hypothetical protein EDC91_102125 [Shewanella fodinae]
MKFTLTASALLALLSSSSVFAANLNIPMSFEYLALDGQEVETNHFTHKSELTLSEGEHKIAIRYSDVYEDGISDSPNFVKSSPFIVTLNVNGDYQYLLAPKNKVVSPKDYAKAPNVVITRKDGGTVDYSIVQTQLKEDSFVSKLLGTDTGVDIDSASAAVTAGKEVPVATMRQPTAVEAMTAPMSTTEANSPATKADSAAHAGQMLQYWWLHADAATRKEFMSWAIKQL